MRVYLCRHAESPPGEPDALRELSPAGRLQAARLAEQLATADAPPAAVLASPLLRARQTAELVAAASDAELRVVEALAPGATVDGLRAALAGVAGPVATVGHQPDCSEIALELTGRDPGFPPGGMTALELEP